MTQTLRSDAGEQTLAAVALRQPVAVVDVHGDDELAARLHATGLWPEVVVEIVGAAPFGDPLLVQLHGFRLALRRSEAARITVRAVELQP